MRRRRYTRAERKAVADLAAARLDRLGLSDAMWERLVECYQARLARERGMVASYNDGTLVALQRRGLVAVVPIPMDKDSGLWSATDEGKALALKGRD